MENRKEVYIKNEWPRCSTTSKCGQFTLSHSTVGVICDLKENERGQK